MDSTAPPTVEARLKQVLRTRVNARPALVDAATAATPLLGQGVGLDSVEAVTLACAVEEEFGIRIPDEDLTLGLFETFGALCSYVAGAGRGHPGPPG